MKIPQKPCVDKREFIPSMQLSSCLCNHDMKIVSQTASKCEIALELFLFIDVSGMLLTTSPRNTLRMNQKGK